MSILKTGFIAASLCLAASFAHADSSVPVQGLMSWNNAAKSRDAKSWDAKSWDAKSWDARSAYASAQPRMAKTWTNAKATPFSREALENKSGH